MTDYTRQQEVLHSAFDIETHKATFIDYLEVVIDEHGTIHYAVPSHQMKVTEIGMKKYNISRNDLREMIVGKCGGSIFYVDLEAMCNVCGCVAVWNDYHIGRSNKDQRQALIHLRKAGLYRGAIMDRPSMTI